MTTTRRVGLLLALLATAALALSCSKAKDAINDAAVDTAAGRWTCLDRKADPNHALTLTVDEDGEFSFVDAESDEDVSSGTWKVVDGNVEVKVDKTVAHILDAKDLAVDMGTVTVEVPIAKRSGTVNRKVDLGIRAESTDRVVITPADDKDAKLFPSAPWTCRKA